MKLSYQQLKDQLATDIGPLIDTALVPLKAAQEAAQAKQAELESQQTDFMARIVSRSTSRDDREHKPGIQFARYVRALVAGKGHKQEALNWARDKYGSESEVAKALGTGVATAGSEFVPQDLSADVIEALRPRSVVRALGATTLPMVHGNMRVSRFDVGSAASYIGENTAQDAVQPTTGELVLSFKKLRAVVPVSNEELAFSSVAVDEKVRNDVVAALASREDKQFIRANAALVTPFTPATGPSGILQLLNGANTGLSAATAAPGTLAEIETDLKDLINALEGKGVTMIKPGWIMSTRTKNYMMMLRESVGGSKAFPDLAGQNPTLLGWPVGVTSHVPTTITIGASGAVLSELYLVDFADVIIGEATELEVTISNEATYSVAGVLHSAFDEDQTLIRVIERHDLGLRHDFSAAVRTSVFY